VISVAKITTEWQRFEALGADGLYELLRFRQGIFVVEQCSPFPDLDGLDQEAWHLLLRAEGALAGARRLSPADPLGAADRPSRCCRSTAAPRVRTKADG